MSTFKVHSLLLVIACALVGGGCTARLATKVEIYHPELRMLQLQEKRRSNSPPTRIETKLREQLDNHRKQKGVAPQDWYRERLADLRAYAELATNVTKELEKFFVPANAVHKKFITDYLVSNHDLVQGASNDLETIWINYGSGDISFSEAEAQIVSRLFRFSKEFARSIDPVEAGDRSALPKAVREKVVAVPNRLVQSGRTLGEQAANLRIGRPAAEAQHSSKDGVFRTDSVVETYTDPLVRAALDDPLGWTSIPAGTLTEADGKSSVVIVRDGQFSFSVHSFDNDPTEVIAARARMAVSTAKIIAESVAMFSGVPGLPKLGGSPSGTNTSATNAAAPPVGLPASVYLAIARDRERRVATLLKEKPADAANAAAVQKWINEVNALFEPLILNQP